MLRCIKFIQGKLSDGFTLLQGFYMSKKVVVCGSGIVPFRKIGEVLAMNSGKVGCTSGAYRCKRLLA